MRRPLIPMVALVLAACSPGTADTTATTAAPTTTTTTAAPTTTTTRGPTTTTTLSPGDLVLPIAREEMPDTWREVFFIPYGTTPETLGTSPGGDAGSVLWGPEYGAQAPDGSWWFLDTAKLRLAHFGADGSYLEEVVVPESMLVNGAYFQWASPRVMNDGTVLASRYPSTTHFLRYRDGSLDEFAVPVSAIPRYDDGEIVYAFDLEDSSLWAIDPNTGGAEPVDAMRARDGNRFDVSVTLSRIHIELPDAAISRDLVFTAEEVGGEAGFGIEVATDHEGSLHILVVGIAVEDESLQLAGYVRIGADGSLQVMEPMMNPFTESDPGTPARLGVTPGTTNPTFMVVGTDGVRVYTRD